MVEFEGGMSDKERKLLSFFRKNARLALTNISRKTGIPVSTIFDKLRKYEKTIITKHTALIDFTKLGYTSRASVFIKTTPQNRKRLKEYLRLYPNVNNIYRINNGYDFMIDCIFKTVKDLESFLEMLELKQGVTGREVFFIIEEISREHFLSEPEIPIINPESYY